MSPARKDPSAAGPPPRGSAVLAVLAVALLGAAARRIPADLGALFAVFVVICAVFSAVFARRLIRTGRLAGAAALALALAALVGVLVPQQDPALSAEARYAAFARAEALPLVALAGDGRANQMPPGADAWLAAVRDRFGDATAGEERGTLIDALDLQERQAAIGRFVIAHDAGLRRAFGYTERLGLSGVFRSGAFLGVGALFLTTLLARALRARQWRGRRLAWRILEVGLALAVLGAVADSLSGRRGTVQLRPGETTDAVPDTEGERWAIGYAARVASVVAEPPRRLIAEFRDVPAGVAASLIRHDVPLRPGATLTLSPGPAGIDVTVAAIELAAANATRLQGRGPPALKVRWERSNGTGGEAWLLEGAEDTAIEDAASELKLWLADPRAARPPRAAEATLLVEVGGVRGTVSARAGERTRVGDTDVEVLSYIPSFRVGTVTADADVGANPAARVAVSSPRGRTTLWAFGRADFAGMFPSPDPTVKVSLVASAWDGGAATGLLLVAADDGNLTVTAYADATPTTTVSVAPGGSLVMEREGLTFEVLQSLPAGSEPRHVAVPAARGFPAARVLLDAPEGLREVWLLIDDPLSVVTMGNVRLRAASDPSGAPAMRVGVELSDPSGAVVRSADLGPNAPLRFAGLDIFAIGGDADIATLLVVRAPGWPVSMTGLVLLVLGGAGAALWTLASARPVTRIAATALVGAGLLGSWCLAAARAADAGPALRSALFAPHMATTRLGLGILAVAAALAGLRLIAGRRPPRWLRLDRVIAGGVDIGFTLLTVGLALGALWARGSWGSWGSWDPKEVVALVPWLLCVAHRHLRARPGWIGRPAAAFLLVAAVFAALPMVGFAWLPGAVSTLHGATR